ncbi:MAG TPA: hypothetical protein DDX93_03905 [Smithella sp.]|jgi:hypothetical protein|nr:hypothetical protein [Smithella sp.]
MKFGEINKNLEEKITDLNSQIWENKLGVPTIDEWLNNFKEEEKIMGLHLLANFLYYNEMDIKSLCKTLCSTFYRYAIFEKITASLKKDENDWEIIENIFKEKLKRTRFLGIGNPSESGWHILYYFRQENSLPLNLFNQLFEVEQRFEENGDIDIVVLIDDFIGTGSQAKKFWNYLNKKESNILKCKNIYYLSLFGTASGIKEIENNTSLQVHVAEVFDESYKCFSTTSYVINDDAKKKAWEIICQSYGEKLYPVDDYGAHPLGFNDSQLLVGFHHNIPNNTLPIIWSDNNWIPIFMRKDKIYNFKEFRKDQNE